MHGQFRIDGAHHTAPTAARPPARGFLGRARYFGNIALHVKMFGRMPPGISPAGGSSRERERNATRLARQQAAR